MSKKNITHQISLKLLLMLVSLKTNKFYLKAAKTSLLKHLTLLETNPWLTLSQREQSLYRLKRIKKFSRVLENYSVYMDKTNLPTNFFFDEAQISKPLFVQLKDNFIFRFSPFFFLSLQLSLKKKNYLTSETLRRLESLVYQMKSQERKIFLNFLFEYQQGHLLFDQIQKQSLKQKLLSLTLQLKHNVKFSNFDSQNFASVNVLLAKRFLKYHKTHAEISQFWRLYALQSDLPISQLLLRFFGGNTFDFEQCFQTFLVAEAPDSLDDLLINEDSQALGLGDHNMLGPDFLILSPLSFENPMVLTLRQHALSISLSNAQVLNVGFMQEAYPVFKKSRRVERNTKTAAELKQEIYNDQFLDNFDEFKNSNNEPSEREKKEEFFDDFAENEITSQAVQELLFKKKQKEVFNLILFSFFNTDLTLLFKKKKKSFKFKSRVTLSLNHWFKHNIASDFLLYNYFSDWISPYDLIIYQLDPLIDFFYLSTLKYKQYLLNRNILVESTNPILYWQWKNILTKADDISLPEGSLNFEWDLYSGADLASNVFKRSKNFLLDDTYAETLYPNINLAQNLFYFDPIPFSIAKPLPQQYKKYDFRSDLERLFFIKEFEFSQVTTNIKKNIPDFLLYLKQMFFQNLVLNKDLSLPYKQQTLRNTNGLTVQILAKINVVKNTWLNWAISLKQCPQSLNQSKSTVLYINHPFFNAFHTRLYKIYNKKLFIQFLVQDAFVNVLERPITFWSDSTIFSLITLIKKRIIFELHLEKIDFSEDFLSTPYVRLNRLDFSELSMTYPLAILKKKATIVGYTKFLQNSLQLYDWYFFHFNNSKWYDFLPVQEQLYTHPQMSQVLSRLDGWANLQANFEIREKKYIIRKVQKQAQELVKDYNFKLGFRPVKYLARREYYNYPDRFVLVAKKFFAMPPQSITVLKNPSKFFNLFTKFMINPNNRLFREFTQTISDLVLANEIAQPFWQDKFNVKNLSPTLLPKNYTAKTFSQSDLSINIFDYSDYFNANVSDSSHYKFSNILDRQPRDFLSNSILVQPTKKLHFDYPLVEQLKKNPSINKWLFQDRQYYLYCILNHFNQTQSYNYQQISKLYFLTSSLGSTESTVHLLSKKKEMTRFILSLVQDSFIGNNSNQKVVNKQNLHYFLELLVISYKDSGKMELHQKQLLLRFINKLFFFRDISYLCEEPLGEFWYSFFTSTIIGEQLRANMTLKGTEVPFMGFSKYLSFSKLLQTSFTKQEKFLFTQFFFSHRIFDDNYIEKTKYYNHNTKLLKIFEVTINSYFNFATFLKIKTQESTIISQFLLNNFNLNKTIYYYQLNTSLFWQTQCDFFLLTQVNWIIIQVQSDFFFFRRPFFSLNVKYASQIFALIVYFIFFFKEPLLISFVTLLFSFCYCVYYIYIINITNISIERELKNELAALVIETKSAEEKYIPLELTDLQEFKNWGRFRHHLPYIIERFLRYELIVFLAKNPTSFSQVVVPPAHLLKIITSLNKKLFQIFHCLFSKKSINVLENGNLSSLNKLKLDGLYWGIRLTHDYANRNPLFYAKKLSNDYSFWQKLKQKWFVLQLYHKWPFWD